MLHVICNVSYVAFHIICIIVFPKKLFFLKISNPKKISEQELTLVSDWGDTLEAHTDTRRESFTWLIYDSFTAFISYWNIMLIYCWWLVSDDVIMTSLKTLWWRHLILFQVLKTNPVITWSYYRSNRIQFVIVQIALRTWAVSSVVGA